MKKRDLYYERIPTKLLREDIRLLGTFLGRVIKDQEGPAFFEIVERLRLLSKNTLLDKNKSKVFSKISKEVKKLSPEKTFKITRAFSHILNLMNLAESLDASRKLNEYENPYFKNKSQNLFIEDIIEGLFKNKNISIFGGGDSALDWALELSKFSKINLIHRREEFRGAPHTLSEIKKLEKEGKISIKTPCQLDSIQGDTNIESITLKFDDGETEKIKTDIVLSFFGLIMKLGPIAEWGLSMNKKTIEVNSENFQTNKKGIFAAGDICTYPGKLKLILSGFHEVALASVECFKRARPNEKYRFEFTTSSKNIQERLGKK